MPLPFRKPKIEVTIDGNGFDNPSGGFIRKTAEIWTANLIWPNLHGKMFEYFLEGNIVRIYVGLDAIPDKPTFTGFVTTDSGDKKFEVNLHGRLHASKTNDVILDNFTNLDGNELSQGIYKLFEDFVDVSFNKKFLGTKPAIYLDNDFRYENGAFVYDVVKALRDKAIDQSDFTHAPLRYVLYEEDTSLYFRKEPPLNDDTLAWWELIGSDNLFMTAPISKVFGIINRQTVIGKDGVRATYQFENTIAVGRVFAGKPIKDETLTTSAECYLKAREIVEKSKLKVVNTKITALELIEAIPRLSLVNIVNASNIKNGIHRIENVDIMFTGGFKVTAGIEKSYPLFGESVLASLSAIA